MTFFVKGLDKNSDGLNCIKQKFPNLSDLKLKGVFVGPQIKKCLH
jgi:hypothetical protein